MSDPNSGYKLPFRQNRPMLIMGVESNKLVGAIILAAGFMIFNMNKVGVLAAIVYWIFYNKTQKEGGLTGGPIHALWRSGLWPDGKKYKYDPNDKDLYS